MLLQRTFRLPRDSVLWKHVTCWTCRRVLSGHPLHRRIVKSGGGIWPRSDVKVTGWSVRETRSNLLVKDMVRNEHDTTDETYGKDGKPTHHCRMGHLSRERVRRSCNKRSVNPGTRTGLILERFCPLSRCLDKVESKDPQFGSSVVRVFSPHLTSYWS